MAVIPYVLNIVKESTIEAGEGRKRPLGEPRAVGVLFLLFSLPRRLIGSGLCGPGLPDEWISEGAGIKRSLGRKGGN